MNKIITRIGIICLLVGLYSCNTADNKAREKKVSTPTLDVYPLKELTHISYSLNPGQNTIIECEQGTLIYYYANSLVNLQNDLITDSVIVQVAEFYQAADFIKNNITTHFKNKLLQTGGAVHISFKQKGKDLKIKAGETYQIAFPKKKNDKKNKMNFYEGNKKDGYIVWDRKITENETKWGKNFFSEVLDIKDYYLFSSNVLFWGNCDSELDTNELTSVALDIDTLPKTNILLIFPSIKGICAPLETRSNYLMFGEVAMKTPGILFGYAKINNDYYYCNENLVINTRNQVIKPKFIKSTRDKIMKITDGIKWD